MDHLSETVKAMEQEFLQAEKEAENKSDYEKAGFYQKQSESLRHERVLDLLSRYCVIPKYGFPVDVVELQVYREGRPDNRYDLSRDLRVAISEYAPDSEVIVDGKKYTSKYVTLPKIKGFTRHYFCTCPNCRKVNVHLSEGTDRLCKYCGEPIGSLNWEYYIEPAEGFKTGITKESTRMKPKRSYAGEVFYLGGGQKDEAAAVFGEMITAESSSNDRLLVMNKSRFYICPRCGYAEIIKGNIPGLRMEQEHKNFRQYNCENETLQPVRLGHSFETDVARLIIPLLRSQEREDYAKALSFLYAFLEGFSMAAGIERKDIDGILELNLEKGSYDVLIYDNVPGGAGHVKRLIDEEIMRKALESARSKVLQNCCDENTSCYNCLRNYYNQSKHSLLRRGYAREIIDLLAPVRPAASRSDTGI